MEKKEIFQEIVCLDASNACQDTDAPPKNIKENADMFTDFVHPSINGSSNSSDFSSVQMWFLFLKKIAKIQKIIIDQ